MGRSQQASEHCLLRIGPIGKNDRAGLPVAQWPHGIQDFFCGALNQAMANLPWLRSTVLRCEHPHLGAPALCNRCSMQARWLSDATRSSVSGPSRSMGVRVNRKSVVR